MSAGILVFRNSFPGAEGATTDLYTLFSQFYSRLYYPEQAIFDIYLGAHKGFRHWELDEKFGAFPGAESNSNAILHAYGSKKFWSGLHNDGWRTYYYEWLSQGGWTWIPPKTKLRKFWRAAKHICANSVNTLWLFRT